MNEGSAESVALGTAIACGAILARLLDALADKGIFQDDDIKGFLQQTQNALAADYGSAIGREAGRVVTSFLADFSKKNP